MLFYLFLVIFQKFSNKTMLTTTHQIREKYLQVVFKGFQCVIFTMAIVGIILAGLKWNTNQPHPFALWFLVNSLVILVYLIGHVSIGIVENPYYRDLWENVLFRILFLFYALWFMIGCAWLYTSKLDQYDHTLFYFMFLYILFHYVLCIVFICLFFIMKFIHVEYEEE